MKNLKLTENNQKDFEKAVLLEMESPIKHFERELVAIRTGRAHNSLIENIKVMCYGSKLMNLKDIASIATPDARLITVQPWDMAIIGEIEKAITTSDLGVTPVNDGNLIRIRLPEMSSARRDELVKILHKKLEEARITIRNVRKDFHNLIRDSEKTKQISEDYSKRLSDTLQKITDKIIQTVEQLSQKKEQEIKTI